MASSTSTTKVSAAEFEELKKKVEALTPKESDIVVKTLAHLGSTKAPSPMDLSSIEVLTNPSWWPAFFEGQDLKELDLVGRFDDKSQLEEAFRRRLVFWATANGAMSLSNYISSRTTSLTAIFISMARAYVRFPANGSILTFLKENSAIIQDAVRLMQYLAEEKVDWAKPGSGKFFHTTLFLQKKDYPSFLGEAIDTATKIRVSDNKRERDGPHLNRQSETAGRGRGKGGRERGRGRSEPPPYSAAVAQCK